MAKVYFDQIMYYGYENCDNQWVNQGKWIMSMINIDLVEQGGGRGEPFEHIDI